MTDSIFFLGLLFVGINTVVLAVFVPDEEDDGPITPWRGYKIAWKSFFNYLARKNIKKVRDEMTQLKVDHKMALIDEKNRADKAIEEIRIECSEDIVEAYKKAKEKYSEAHENIELEVKRRLKEELLKHRNSVPEDRFAQANRKRQEKQLNELEEELKYSAREQKIKDSEQAVNEKMQSVRAEILLAREERQNIRDERFEITKQEFEVRLRESELSTERKKLLIEIAVVEMQRKELRLEADQKRHEMKERIYELRLKVDDFKMNKREWSLEKKENEMELYNKNLQLLKREIDQQYQFKLDDIYLREGQARNEKTLAGIEREKVAVDMKYNTSLLMMKEAALSSKAMGFTQIEMDRKIQVIEAIESKWYFNNDMTAMEAYKTAGYYLENPIIQENRALEKLLKGK